MLSHGRAKVKPPSSSPSQQQAPPSSSSISSEVTAQAPRKMSHAATLRRNWSQREMKKKSLPAALPSFSDFELSSAPNGGGGGGGALGVASVASVGGAVISGTTGVSGAAVGPSVKTRSRASRASDAISKFLNRRSSDNTTSAAKVSKPTTPATSEERRFWPRRLTSETKVVPELAPNTEVAGIGIGPGGHLSPTKEDSVSVATTTVAPPTSKPSQPANKKSDTLRGPHHTVSALAAASANTKPHHHHHTGKPRVTPNTTTTTTLQPSHSRHGGNTPTPRTPSPPLDPPFTPQYTLRKFGSELTALEKHEVLQYGDIFFFSSLEIKSRRHNGKIYNCAAAFDEVKSGPVEESTSEPSPPEASAPAASAPAASAPVATELFNDGYDNERGDYLLLAQDHLAFRFEVLHVLGSGSFGQVVCCLDHQTQQQVAVKIIRNRKKYKEQSLIEVQILSQLQTAMSKRSASSASASELHHPGGVDACVVKMHEYFLFRNHLCISFELLGINLYEYLKLRFFQGLPMANIRDIAAQLVATLKLLHAQRVIHCDLKPENILIKPKSSQSVSSTPSVSQRSLQLLSAQNVTTAQASLRVEEICLIDFGSSCLETTAVFTYIQSRFYRSPEVILGFPYSTAIDMWSLGCILVELHTGYPIFAGENETEQLACIMELFGEPSRDLLMSSRRRKHFFTESSSTSSSVATAVANAGGVNSSDPPSPELLTFQVKPFVNSRGRRRTPGSRSLLSAIKSDDVQFIEFVRKCLVMDPRKRMTPEQAERDPWLRSSTAGTVSGVHAHHDVDGCDNLDDAASRTHSISLSQEVIEI